MSLHQLAHHVQSAGRGDDKVLVHMTPKEVGGLQALAMAHGGSLTINPETGLPEANFLKSLLPAIAGFGLSMIPGVGPLMAAGIVGGGTALATGNLGKGLMAGLGAYGGAGLGTGLTQTGTAQLTAAEAAKTAGTTPGANLSSSMWAKDPGIATAGREFGVAGAGAAGAPSYTALDKLAAGTKALGQEGGFSNLYKELPGGTLPALGIAALGSMSDQKRVPPLQQSALVRPYTYERTQRPGVYDMGAPMYAAAPGSSAERLYFNDQYTALTPYKAPGPEYPSAADGGLVALAVGGPVEQMSAMNAVGDNMMYPQAQLQTPLYSNPAMQRPEAVNVISPSAEPAVGMYSGEQKFAKGGVASTTGEYKYNYNPQTMQFTQTAAPTYGFSLGSGPAGKLGSVVLGALEKFTGKEKPPIPSVGTVSGGMTQLPAPSAIPAQPAYTPPSIPEYQTPEDQLGLNAFYGMMDKSLGEMRGYAGGGEIYNLGSYSDGGRLLKGPGDGVSDSIPAVIGQRQPARLADGEFVIPARIVSELGNGSTEAGARKLYAMMDRVQNARRKSMGKKKVAVDSRAEKLLPA